MKFAPGTSRHFLSSGSLVWISNPTEFTTCTNSRCTSSAGEATKGNKAHSYLAVILSTLSANFNPSVAVLMLTLQLLQRPLDLGFDLPFAADRRNPIGGIQSLGSRRGGRRKG